ncbi:gephyrin-like molybdotransferase Glp [Phenylobacterium sp.]|uniref:molybdopterin molybdotransferase MoeA n=1 Tax=Phenylobacterium sp. TaxID=1871053 RepID=UPI002734F64E|nr:gephyrin-like molybdotransferase Glp [Phenylobacterium sp.]MDP3659900.1 molybdopterin molybdotransferase MoeA [Phenylobacterium sp.]
MKLMTVEAARAAMLAEIPRLPSEDVALDESIGRVLAQDVAAIRDQPPFDASAMDGWAVRSGDGAGERTIIGESAAGHGFEGELGAGQAVRIFTGAALPAGADAVVIQEDAERRGDRVAVPAAGPRQNVRPRGGDFTAGQALLGAGVRIDPWRLSLAAAAGRHRLGVAARPRVAVLSTGEEIVEAPATPGAFQIYDSGSPSISALVEGCGGRVRRDRPVRDTLEAMVEALREAEADLIVTIGGASVGDHDLVRVAADVLGFAIKVESVAVRPGKPTFFGVLADGRRLLGLPGNPASAFVCAELFLKPILAAYQGAAAEPVLASARLTAPLPANGPREHWMRARLDHADGALAVLPYRDQDSSLITVFAQADALLRRQAGAPAAAAGDLVDVLALSRA